MCETHINIEYIIKRLWFYKQNIEIFKIGGFYFAKCRLFEIY
jgi:hypothetical protein